MELDSKYYAGNSINLQGYTSTTQDRGVALHFAIGQNIEEFGTNGKVPILVEIKIKGKQQLFFLNSD